MSTSYTPRAGSLPARVIKHLADKGGKLNAAQIAQKFEANPTSVATLLKKSVDAGLLKIDTSGKAFEWSLPDGVVTDSAASDASDTMVISAWPDGDITLQGVVPNDDGIITFTPRQIARIAMHRPGARAV